MASSNTEGASISYVDGSRLPRIGPRKSVPDALGRRGRERRAPSGKLKRPTPRNLMWLEKLSQHGPLPSSYLHAFSARLCRNATWARRELTDLFHEETVHGGPYLDRPWQQFDTIDARHNDLVYDITDAGIAALTEAGCSAAPPHEINGPWVHRCMVACITASIDLAVQNQSDLRFIPKATITDRLLRAIVPFRHRGRQHARELIPDALFALAYRTAAGERYRLFLVEADRATEPGRSQSFDRKSCLRTALQYREYVGMGLYKEHLGVHASMLVLNVTTSAARMENMLTVVDDASANGQNSFMLFQQAPQFGRYFKPPKPLPQLLHSPWRRAGHSELRIDAT